MKLRSLGGPIQLVLSLLTAVLATATSVLVALLAATIITVDGDARLWIAVAAGLSAGVLLPAMLATTLVRSLQARGQKIRALPIFCVAHTTLDLVTVGVLFAMLPDLSPRATDGWALLSQAPTTTEVAIIETRGPAPGTAPPIAEAQTAVAALLHGRRDGAIESLSNASAAALGIVWMRHLHPLPKDQVDPALVDAVLRGLPAGPTLFDDAAQLEPLLRPRGRAFLQDVRNLADALQPGEGVGPLSWPLIDPQLVHAEASGQDPAWTGSYRQLERDRIHAELLTSTFTLRREDGAWRIDLGDFGDLTTRQVDRRLLWLAMRP